MRHPIARRSGFTLIELLVVIGIIGLLSAITFGLFRAANNSRNKSKSRGDIQAIALACQSYRKTYGDFPASATGAPDRFRRDLLDQLVGRRLIRTTTPGGLPVLLNYDDTSLPTGSAGRQMRSFLGLGEITTNDDAKLTDPNDWRGGNTAACREFVDAWGNPYDYRYRVLTAAKYNDWKSPNFLFVCASAKYAPATVEGEILDLGEYWDPAASGGTTMDRSGIVPGTYFDETGGDSGPFRADNLVNWAN
jgi:prepilin-type N-terminal cleavage/methylation domain-containing protein